VVGEGFALLGVLIAALLAHRPLARLLQADDQREDACNAIHRCYPYATLFIVSFVAFASVGVLYYGGLDLGRFSSYHGHLFFLGAAFLLLEVHAVNRLALLFGTM